LKLFLQPTGRSASERRGMGLGGVSSWRIFWPRGEDENEAIVTLNRNCTKQRRGKKKGVENHLS
jgi:hypothetical protein